MAKLPMDLTKVSAADLFPEGRFRVRIASAEVQPKDKQLGESGEIVGVFSDEGKQKYAALNVGYRFTEHANNVAVDPRSGEAKNLAGRMIFDRISFHPEYVRHVRELYDASGTEADGPTESLLGKEVDIIIKHRARRDDPDVKESRVDKVRIAVG